MSRISGSLGLLVYRTLQRPFLVKGECILFPEDFKRVLAFKAYLCLLLSGEYRCIVGY